ncbi:hypothetical protein V8Q18_09255 [Acinetobacter baumannii]
MSEFKVGQEIKGRFRNFCGEVLVLEGRIREIKNGVLCCNELSSGRPFFVHPKEVEDQSENLGDDFPIENHISPNCKVEDV